MDLKPPSLAAVTYVDRDYDIPTLKRAALFFDNVHYVLPMMLGMTRDAFAELADRSRTNGPKSVEVDPADYFKTAYPIIGVTLSYLGDERAETIAALEEAGIFHEARPARHILPDRALVDEVERTLIAADVSDRAFRKNVGLPAQEPPYETTGITIRIDDENMQHDVVIIGESTAVRESRRLTNVLALAGHLGAAPLIPGRYQRMLLERRFTQYKAGVAQLVKSGDFVESDLQRAVGSVADILGGLAIRDEVVQRHSATDIIKYRTAMAAARQKFIADDLLPLAALVEDAPWSAETRKKVHRYVEGKLKHDMMQYIEEGRRTWESLFGQLSADAFQYVTQLASSSGAGHILGGVLPNTNPWTVALLGALAATAKKGPEVVKKLTDAALQQRARERSSIAYLAKIQQA